MMVLDISDSMLAEDVYPNRLKLAKSKALELLRLAPNERIGAIAFAKNSYLVSPLSFDHDAVAFLLSQLNTDSITEKGTDFMSMLQVVSQSMQEESKKYILLFSDGGDKKDFSQEIAYANEQNITVFVLGMGTPQGAPIRKEDGSFIKLHGKIIVSKLNQAVADFATKTGGVYIENVNSNEDIKMMLHEIETHAKKKELKSEKIEKYIPLFYYPIGLALMLLLFATSSMSKREHVNVPSAFLIFGLLVAGVSPSKAALLDFMKLQDAKEAYEAHNYAKAKQLYGEVAQEAGHPEGYYNEGNALYKQKKYKEAIESYEKARFDTKKQRANNSANIGNAYVKLGGEANLKKAVEAYEESLKTAYDKEVQENLEAVKKALKKMQKKKQQKKQNKQNKSDKKNKQNKSDKQNNSDKKNKSDNQNKQSKSDKQDKQNKQNKSDKQNSSDKQSKSEKQNSSHEQNKENNSQKQSQKNKQTQQNRSQKQKGEKTHNTAQKDKEK
jgi:Ca-activated chloride channel family protein